MTLLLRDLFVVAAAVTALAASSASSALAQTTAHSHDAAAPHKRNLNQGRKWATATRTRGPHARLHQGTQAGGEVGQVVRQRLAQRAIAAA